MSKLDDILMRKQLPKAIELRTKLNEQCDVLDNLKLQQSYELDKLSLLQMQYAIVTQAELTAEQDVMYHSLLAKLDEQPLKDYPYEVKKNKA